MARVLQDGFDSYAVTADLAQTYGYNSFSVSTTGGRFGGGCVVGNGAYYANLFAAGAFAIETWMGVAVEITASVNNDSPIMEWISAGASQSGCEMALTYNASTQVLKVWKGGTGVTLLGSASVPTFTVGGWHWIDCHYKYSATVGVAEVWLDNVQVINVTGANTAENASITSLIGLSLGAYVVTANQSNIVFDDWIVNDTTGSINNGRVGDHRIETVKPVSDATPNNGTCSTGTTHYAMVNESQWNTTNYITMTNTSGQEELFGMADLAGTPPSISAVKVVYIGEKTDAGAASLETALVSSGVPSYGASTPMLTTWGRQGATYELDPNTSAAWAYGAVNAMQAGWKVP